MKTEINKRKPSSLLKLLPLSFVIFNGILAVSAIIAAYMSWTLAVIIAVLLGLVVITISFLYQESSFSWTALIAVVASLICGMSISRYYDIKDREIIKKITLADAVNYQDAGGYTFTEGRVRTDLIGTYAKRSKSVNSSSSTTFYYAAPVVNESWSSEKAVTVWVVQQSYLKKKHWEQPFRAGLRVDAIYREELSRAVKVAERSHGLKSHSKAVLIEWTGTPTKAVDAYLDEFKETTLVFNIIWLTGLLGGRVFFYLHRKKKTTSKIPSSDTKEQNKRQPIATSDLLRFLFVVYCFFAIVFSLFFSGIDFTSLLPIMLLVISIVFFIISFSALLGAHKKEERPLNDLLFVMVYPFFVYFMIFFSFDIKNTLFWMFPGYFYFLIITGGFILEILFSPIIALGIRDGSRVIRKNGVVKYAGVILSLAFIALIWFFTHFLAGLTKLTFIQSFTFWLLLLAGIYFCIKFSYRHTTFNLSKDPELRRKYNKKL